MPVVNFVSHFSSCNTDIFCIKNNTHVSSFHMRCIGWLVLALKHNSYLGCQPSKYLSHRQSNLLHNQIFWPGQILTLKQTEEFWPGPLHQKHATATLLNQFSSTLQVLSAQFKKETCVSTTVLVIHILAPWFEYCIHAVQTIGWMQERFILGRVISGFQLQC